MSNNKKIVLDVDGVMLDFMSGYDQVAASVLKREINPIVDENLNHHYHLGKRIGESDEVAYSILDKMVQVGGYRSLKALPGAREAVEMIKQAGYDIYIVTAIPESVKEDRLYNLKNEIGLIPKEMFCVGMGQSKKEVIESINPDVFIDDRITYLSSVPNVYHLVLIDLLESQDDNHTKVDVISPSLKVWADKYLNEVTEKLDNYYKNKMPLQNNIALENMDIRLDRRKRRKISM